MVFSDTATGKGILQGIDFLVSSDRTKYPANDVARNVNIWYRRVVGWIWEACGDWKFDDVNFTTSRPVLTTTLVAGQEDYTLPTANGEGYGEIDRVEVLNSSGDYEQLSRIEKSKILGAVDEYGETDGMPSQYYVEGNSLILKPAPAAASVTTTAGLKIYTTRDIDEFTGSDTTQEPGFNRNWHSVLVYGGALEYATAKLASDTNKITVLRDGIKEIHNEIIKYYLRRNNTDTNKPRRIRKEVCK